MEKEVKNQKMTSSRIHAPSPEDEIVISGISGKFPSAKNVSEFAEKLYNKVDMVSVTEKRWPNYHAEIPTRMGVLDNTEKFDATFFGVPFKQTNSMDPQCRLLIETAYEAILDAGICPKSIRGTKTGVFIGACFGESEKAFFYDPSLITSTGLGITGCSRAMLANRVSYCLGLVGPSFMLDTACSSSMYALDMAFSALRNGECEAALVGGSNLCLHPFTTLQFARLGVIAKDGYCRPFDHKASGYTRSEAVCVMYLQRKKDAKRIYANVIYSKANCDGFKIEGITYPSGDMQQALLSEFYSDLQMDPTSLGYVEAHSTGTFVGDPEECRALDNIFCRNRKEPLLVGSVKSNIGHTESTSGACSIAKVILTFENGLIPPNINFEKIRSTIPALAEGRMRVCNETTTFSGDKIAVNSFGFGGANAHALLSMNPKRKINNGIPDDNIPRLVNWAGRTEEAVVTMLNALESQSNLDAEYIGLLHNAQSEEVQGYLFRGYTILCKDNQNSSSKTISSLARATKRFDGNRLPVVWLFSGMGSQWSAMGKSLMIFNEFRETVEGCHKVLQPFGVDLISVITSDDPKLIGNIVNAFVGIACVQIGLVNLLRLLNIQMDYCIGHSVGELGCAYADGTITVEQAILAAFARGIVSFETKVIDGSMAAIGIGYEQVAPILPPTIECACHNNFESTTISGPKADIAKFVSQLKGRGIFAKEVQCSNIPYHSRYIAEMGPKLLKRLKDIISKPMKRSPKWLSTSVPRSEWNQLHNTFSSAEYHTNNLLKPVLFEETSRLLPAQSIVIEIAPHGLLQAIVKKSLPAAVHVPLTQRDNANNAVFFLSALGKMFLNGVTIPIERLYPKVEFPVSRATPMISPLIKWDHSEDWYVMKFSIQKNGSGERKVTLSLDEDDYISGHIIDGRIIVPGTTYLQLAWETLAIMTKGAISAVVNVEFEDVRFLRATTMSTGQQVELTIMIHYGSGSFEISENGVTVVSGSIREVETTESEDDPIKIDEFHDDCVVLDKNDFYKELRLRGYHYQQIFQGIERARSDGSQAIIKWNENWPAFMDNMLQLNILSKDTRSLYLPTRIRRVRINSMKHQTILSRNFMENGDLIASYDPHVKLIKCGGVEIYDMNANAIARRKAPGIEILESYRFLPFVPSETLTLISGVHVLTQLIIENTYAVSKLKILEIDSIDATPLITAFDEAISKIPLIKCELQFLTGRSVSFENATIIKDVSKGNLLTITMDDTSRRNESILQTIENDSFLLVRKPGNTTFTDLPPEFQMITAIPTENETLVLLQRKVTKTTSTPPTIIDVLSTDYSYQWLDIVKRSMKSGPTLLVAQNDVSPGLLGLVNCLRREPGGENIRCVILMDRLSPKFSLNESLYASQIALGLTVNVYRNSVWGTYRFFELMPHLQETNRLDHVYANVRRMGDLSSFDWFNGPLSLKSTTDRVINVHYASINFRDVMVASSRLSVEFCRNDRTDSDCVLGLEFSGITSNGERVMGMVKSGAMATQVKPVDHLTWIIPKDWSLRDGATIPAVYITVYYAFFFGNSVARGNSILIHAGSGGIGLAAIRVALAYGLEVFTTVSTPQKRKFILSLFPQLKDENIGNSRDCSFERMVMRQTKGRGVNFVLNSLSDDKLLASVRCLSRGGTFLEIGKFDILNNSALGMKVFEREITFRAVFADNLIDMPDERKIIHELIDKDIRTGIIQPLHSTVFHVNEIEHAYRFMSTGKHVGKVMIQIRESEHSQASVPINVNPKVYCKEDLVYIVAGGLGGFGLELCDWLVIRGARILVINARRGITSSYQAFRISLWESYGCKVIVNPADISTYQGCRSLLLDSLPHGQIGGIFNLAVVLRDGILENQNSTAFQECVGPKSVATRYLNELSRILCPKLEHFVVFSSASCGRGNAGQSNYGMANSIMERIIEQRVQDKLPGKAIQWGAIGEVGLAYEMVHGNVDIEVVGTLPQRIESCLNALDTLLKSPQAIVSSLVVADKCTGDQHQDPKLTLIKSIMKIMGIRDIKAVSTNASLAELGMDSLMTVEIKQVLEREFDVFLTIQQLRSITFAKLDELSHSEAKTVVDDLSTDHHVQSKLLFQNLGDEAISNITLLPINQLNVNRPTILFVPGIEGVGSPIWHTLGSSLKSPAKLIQMMNSRTESDLNVVSNSLIEEVSSSFSHQNEYFIVGHSFGTLIAMKIAALLEKRGKMGHVVLIDGSPKYLLKLLQGIRRNTSQTDNIENDLIMILFTHFCSLDHLDGFVKKLSNYDNLSGKIDLITEFVSHEFKTIYSEKYVHNIIVAVFNRLKLLANLNDQINETNELKAVIDTKLKSPITLIRPTQTSVADITEDYDLRTYSERAINIKYINGNHLTVIENIELSNTLNDLSSHGLSES